MAQDKTRTPVNSQKKAMDLYLAAKAAEAAERDFGKTYIEPLGPGEEISRPDNFLYEALSNPQLNKGLSNLGSATADVLLGKPSGSAIVDEGLSIIPGVGQVSALVAGGMPGVVDIAGPIGGAAKKARLKELLANAAKTREKAVARRESANASSKRYYAKKVAEQEAAVNAAEKAKLKEASDLWKAEKARIGADEVLPGWKVSEHRLGENDSPALRGRTPTTYEQLLGEGATNRDKRAGYYLDSLAGVAAGSMRARENPERLTRDTFSDRKHKYTTYDEAVRKFYDDVEEGIRNGNLPGDGRIVLKQDWNRTIGPFQHPFVKMPDGTEKDLYELLVRPKTNLKTEQILRYAGQL